MKKQKLLTLFIYIFRISSITFGGGYVILPLLQKAFVDDLKWFNNEEIMDIISISQTAPGAVAVNASIMIGFRSAGFIGAFISLLAMVLPPFLIMFIVVLFYKKIEGNEYILAIFKGMQSGISAIIIAVAVKLGYGLIKHKDIFNIIIMLLSFIFLFIMHVSPIYLLISAFIFGLLYFYIFYKLNGSNI